MLAGFRVSFYIVGTLHCEDGLGSAANARGGCNSNVLSHRGRGKGRGNVADTVITRQLALEECESFKGEGERKIK
jgi:hypothetical protein